MFSVRRLKDKKYFAKVGGVKFTMLSLLKAFSKQKNQQQHLTNIPDEIILKIFSYLSIQDLGNWTEVSKRFRNICWDKALPYGEMIKKWNGKDPYLHQLSRYIRNPKISLRKKNERFINMLIDNPDVMARLHKNQKEFIPLLVNIFRANPDLELVFLNAQKRQQHQQQSRRHQQTVQRTDESVRTRFPNQPNRSQQERGFFLRCLRQLARFSCINCF